MSFQSLLLAEVPAAAIVFAVVWGVCRRVNNYGFLDVTWTLMVGILALVDGIWGSGSPARRLLFVGVALLWSMRLGLYILVRVLRHHPQEDKRYRTLRERWHSPVAFLMFFELQAGIAVIFSLPFLVASMATQPQGNLLEWCGLIVAVVGIVGEASADAQSAAFKRRGRAGGVLDTGLWRYSRHPNYFFELVFWIGIAVACGTLPYGWLAFACPVLIAYFLLRVTGIPLTEKHSLETHGDAYRAYQRRTSAFVPLPLKKLG